MRVSPCVTTTGSPPVFGPPWTVTAPLLAFAPDEKTYGRCSPVGLAGRLLVSAGTHIADATAAVRVNNRPSSQGGK